MIPLLFVGGALSVIGGGAFVYGIAEHEGRRGWLWALVSVLAASIALRIALGIVWLSALDDVDISFLTVLPVLLAPMAVHGASCLLLWKLPAPGGNTRTKRFEMVWTGLPDRDADGRCMVRISRDLLAVTALGDAPSVDVPFRDIISVRADIECLKLAWDAGAEPREATLLLTKSPRTRDGRVRAVQALAKRLLSLRHEALGPQRPDY